MLAAFVVGASLAVLLVVVVGSTYVATRSRDLHCFHLSVGPMCDEHGTTTKERCCFCGADRSVRYAFDPHPEHGRRMRIEVARRIEETVPHGCVR